MPRERRSLVAHLRSRRLAVWLLLGTTFYVWLATLIPQGALDSAEVASWDTRRAGIAWLVRALGLHAAYTTPLFIAVIVLLIASTTACAYERTRDAVHEFRGLGRLLRRLRAKLTERPDAVILVPGDSNAEAVLDRVADALRPVGLRSRRGPSVLEARCHDVGLFGSPLFHWGLVLLFVAAALGQLTKSEGGVNLVLGTAKPDIESNYVPGHSAGPLFFDRYTGVQILAEELDVDHEVSGVVRGEASLLSVRDALGQVRTQWTYANHPMRIGALTIHQTKKWGAALVASITAEEDGSSQRVELYFDVAPETPGRVLPTEVEYTAPSGTTYALRLEARQGRRLAVSSRPSDEDSAEDSESVSSSEQVIGKGESAQLPGGLTFTPLEFTQWTQLTLVNDWSIPFVYAFFVLACVSLPLAIFWPPRSVWVMYREADRRDGVTAALHVVVRARRSDPAFAGRVRAALEAAFVTSEQEGEQA